MGNFTNFLNQLDIILQKFYNNKYHMWWCKCKLSNR